MKLRLPSETHWSAEPRRSAFRTRFRRGSLFTIALITMTFVLVAGGGLMAHSSQSMRRGRFDVMRPRSMALAEAGLERAIYYLRTTAPDGTTDGSWRTTGLSEAMSSDGSYTVTVENGDGVNAGRIVITSVGRAVEGEAGSTYSALEVKSTVRTVIFLDREEVSIWNNAVFGGAGQAGKSINGNVRIRGGVHLLGDGEEYTDTDQDGHWDSGESYTDANGNGKWDTGELFIDLDHDAIRDAPEPYEDVNGNGIRDPALTVTDMSSEFGGTANIGNNYDGMPSTLRDRLPDPSKTLFRGEEVETLRAKLRVKHGTVSLNGNATVGEPYVGGAPYTKDTMDGTFVSDGFTGNAGTGNVYSDNGTSTGYNLGNMLKFPTLTERYERGGVTYESHLAYLASAGLNITGPLTLKPGTSYGPVSDGRGNYFHVDVTGTVDIRGIVNVNGDVSFVSSGGNKDMRYTGRGTLVSTGTLSVETNLVAKNKFPTQDVMGFIARRDMYLGVSSQLMLSGAYYCQQTIHSSKQNELAGTFVSSYFSMKNVPHMYQVPSLVENLPPGMPGEKRIWIKSIRIDSWRDI